MRGALALAVTLAACVAQAPPQAAHALAGTHWMRIDRSEDAPHFPTLDMEQTRASGHAGCNRWNAAVTGHGDELGFQAVATTRIMCAAPAMATERALLEALRSTRRARVEGGQLVLLAASGRELARFDRAD